MSQEDKRRQLRWAFGDAAATLELTMGRIGSAHGAISGDVDGRHIKYSFGTGERGPRANCSVSFDGGALGVGLRIRRRTNRWQRTAVVTGDASFDALMLVKTKAPDRLALTLDASVRREILDLAFDGSLVATDKKISFGTPMAWPDQSAIVATVRRLVSVARALERARLSK